MSEEAKSIIFTVYSLQICGGLDEIKTFSKSVHGRKYNLKKAQRNCNFEGWDLVEFEKTSQHN